MKIALVDDYLNKYGGAAQVLAAIHEIFPEAPIYTSFSNVGKGKDKLLDQKFKNAEITESWLAKIPGHEKLISPLRFLLPLVWGSFDFSNYDLVISSASWAVTKGFARGNTREICYCHTPPRYLYGYETSRNWRKHWYIRAYASLVNHFMRIYDYQQAQKVTKFIANSQVVRKRIKKFYRRKAAVIYPPVEINEKIKLVQKKENYFLTGGRLERAKNFDLIIKACNQLKLPLKIYGFGVQREALEKIAGPTIEFLGRVSDHQKQKLLAKARAFIVAAIDEDFGITPVEAMAHGCPVIAYRGGGYLESVIEGKTGEFFDPPKGRAGKPTVKALVSKLQSFPPKGRAGKVSEFKPEDCRKQAKKFSKERFKKEILVFVKKHA
ncbi:glycosyltransferase [Patescibacteria group bacterium]